MILVTGFGYQQSTNASGILVKSLRDELPEALMPLRDMLAFEVITCDETSRETEHQTLERQLNSLLKHYKPDLCIHTGQAPPYNKITIEKIATNAFRREIIDPRIVDVEVLEDRHHRRRHDEPSPHDPVPSRSST